ncbi:MAG TPA: DNA-primase RepB domain-containing protein [Solirubrobacterales bacterium]
MATAPRPRAVEALFLGPSQPVAMRDRAGRRIDRVLGAEAHAALLTELLHTARPGFVELVAAPRLSNGRLGRFRRSDLENFVRAGRREAFLERVRVLRAGERREVFLTPATLRVPVPGNDSVECAAVAWVDIDDPRRLRGLRAFAHPPHAVVASGSGGAHAYWLLAEEVSGERCEALNRILAAALGADPASTNRGRIMRLPGTLNHKPASRGRAPAWCRVVMCDLAKAPYRPAVLASGLRDPKAPRPARRAPRRPPATGEEPWAQMEAAEYYRAIVGVVPGRDGRVRCPSAVHVDEHPSAQLYSGVGRGWYCFACQAGGGAVDLIAALRGYPTGSALRREQFNECIAELRRIFGGAEPPTRKTRRA